MEAGKFLRQCRKNSNLNQDELAFALGINQSDVSKIERGDKAPALDVFRDWTIQTQSMELGIAFLYGTEILVKMPEVINTVASLVAGFIRLGGYA